ncbi:hypothetical protein [Rahnella victoriana]|uniref:Uncharacterized protein n=1 Tax=Rahnella victoriana TaxID=1510570 RepID=A0ABS0DU06_9GAMM|nr:hypothetical protein [Rahnella victoriana]MBF7957362.1 hypothetical protein [Rahnella victoriana]
MFPTLSSSISYLSEWEDIIDEGNVAYECLQNEEALALYQKALVLAQDMVARKLWLIDSETVGYVMLKIFESSLAALIVTHNNLANLYIRLGDIEMAKVSLLRSHTAMFQLLTEGSLNEEMLSIAERHYQRLQEDMILFLRENPSSSENAPSLSFPPPPMFH